MNFEKIKQALDTGLPYIEEAKNRELVLMIGSAGTGKSTTGNYLLELPIKKEVDEYGIETINVDGNPVFKIGHGTDGETLYAQAANVPNQSWSLLDCPGFAGSRLHIEDSIIESISTELAIRAAINTKAVLVFVELEDFYQTRILKMMPIIRVFNKLFKMPQNMAKNSILILVNKAERNVTPMQLTGCMRRLLTHCETRIQQLHEGMTDTDNLTRNDYIRISDYFTEIQARMMCINPLDNGETRQAIINYVSQISSATPATILDFNFSASSQHRKDFEQYLVDQTSAGINQIDNIKRIIAKIQDNREIEFLKRLHATQLELQRELLENTDHGRAMEQAIEKDQESLRNINEKIASLEETIEECKTRTQDLEYEVREIDNEDDCPFVSEANSLPLHFLGAFRGEGLYYTRPFSAKTTGMTTLEDEPVKLKGFAKSVQNGRWYDENGQEDRIERIENGLNQEKYSIIFKSAYHARFINAEARYSIETFIKKRDDVGNQAKILRLRSQIEEASLDLADYQERLSELQREAEKLQGELVQAQMNHGHSATARQERLNKCNAKIAEYEQNMQAYKEQLRAKTEEGKNLFLAFIGKTDDFVQLTKICNILGVQSFQSDYIPNFIREYSAFYEKIPEYTQIFCIHPPIVGIPSRESVFNAGMFAHSNAGSQSTAANPSNAARK